MNSRTRGLQDALNSSQNVKRARISACLRAKVVRKMCSRVGRLRELAQDLKVAVRLLHVGIDLSFPRRLLAVRALFKNVLPKAPVVQRFGVAQVPLEVGIKRFGPLLKHVFQSTDRRFANGLIGGRIVGIGSVVLRKCRVDDALHAFA